MHTPPLSSYNGVDMADLRKALENYMSEAKTLYKEVNQELDYSEEVYEIFDDI